MTLIPQSEHLLKMIDEILDKRFRDNQKTDFQVKSYIAAPAPIMNMIKAAIARRHYHKGEIESYRTFELIAAPEDDRIVIFNDPLIPTQRTKHVMEFESYF